MLVVATLTSTLTGPGQTIGVSVFIDHFVDDLDLSRSQVSGAYLVGTLTGAALLPVVGRFVDRRGVRLAQLVVGGAFGLALVFMSVVDGLILLALGFTGIRFLGQGSLSLVSVVTVSLRFVRNRATAIGVYSTVSSGLMALLPLVLAFTIGQIGWRSTWLVAAAVVVALVVPMAWFGLTGLPAGGRSGRGGTADRGVGPAGESGDGSLNRGQAMRTRSFWVLAAASAAAGMLLTALNFHQIDLLGDAGLSETAAAALFVPQVIGSSSAALAVGAVGDRVGTRYLPAACMALLASAHWLAAVVEPGAVVLAYAVVLGAAGGSVRTTVAALLPAWFGTAHLGSIQGSLTFFNVGASALGPVALAVGQGQLGSYPPAVVALSILPVAVLVLALGPESTRPAVRT